MQTPKGSTAWHGRNSTSIPWARIQTTAHALIVGAYFTITHEGHTLNLFVFESQQAAAALARIKDAPRPPFVQLESVEVAEVLASF